MTSREQHLRAETKIVESARCAEEIYFKCMSHRARWQARMNHRLERLRIKHNLYKKYAERYSK